MAGHVTNPATKFEDPTSIRSWVTSYNVSHWLPLKMRRRPFCFMHIITWKLKIRLGNRAHCIQHAWIMLKSLVSHFYAKMHLTCTILRNTSRLLGGRKGIRPLKNWAVGCWHGYLSGAWCWRIWPSWCHCHSLSLAPVKSRLVLPFWYWLTQVVLDKGQ